MKLYSLLFISFLFIACKNDIQKNTSNQFFDFDEVEYYHKDITMKEWLEIATKENKSFNEKALLELVNLEYPNSLNDKNFLKNI